MSRLAIVVALTLLAAPATGAAHALLVNGHVVESSFVFSVK